MSLKDSLCHRVALNVGSRSTSVSPLLLVLPWGTATTHHLLPLRSHARCSWGMCACVYVDKYVSVFMYVYPCMYTNVCARAGESKGGWVCAGGQWVCAEGAVGCMSVGQG